MRHSPGPVTRAISILVLGFFSWTFLGLYEIAHAVDQQIKQSPPKSQKPRPEEKFQEALEEAERILSDPSLDGDVRTVKLKGKRIKIEDLDQEIRKEFAKTEKKLKAEGLPPEILERHAKFVKHYEENLKTFRANLEGVEKAKTKEEADTEVGKARAHLEKVKPPKKHIPLDPHKLPHRVAEPTKKKPRLKKEEFQENGQPSATNAQPSAISRQQSKPILVASAGSLAGLLSPNSKLLAPNLLLAQAGNPSTNSGENMRGKT